MYYYGANIIWPTMISVFYVSPNTGISETLIITLPANLGLVGGALLFAITGHRIKHWKLTLILSFTLAVLFGGLLARVTPTNKALMTVAHFSGGSLAVSVYTSVLTSSQSKKALDIVVKASVTNGLTQAAAEQLLTALSLGADAVAAVPGINPAAITAASAAFLDSYTYGLKMMALYSLGFGGLGIVLCLLCEDVGPKMNSLTNVFLENDINAEKNKFH